MWARVEGPGYQGREYSFREVVPREDGEGGRFEVMPGGAEGVAFHVNGKGDVPTGTIVFLIRQPNGCYAFETD